MGRPSLLPSQPHQPGPAPVSAISFVCAYVLVFTHPVAAVLLGMDRRHDAAARPAISSSSPGTTTTINKATHEYKEDVKVGYNLRRKVVLMGIWALSPVALYFDPTLFGIFNAPADIHEFLNNLALTWIALAHRRPAVPHRAPVLPQGRADRARVVHEDPHRPLPRHQALPQGAPLSPARRADRPEARPAPALIGERSDRGGST